MRYYPVNIDIQNRNCLVVGGGAVATRKAATLSSCGARVTVVSPDATNRLSELAENGFLTLIKRPYQAADLEGVFLVIGATNDTELNRKIYEDAEHLKILCNIADQPEICNFILPSVIQRGDLVISISTSGKSPAFAKKLRQDLEKEFGDEYALFLKLMGAVRQKLLNQNHDPETHKACFEQLIEKGLIEYIRDQKKEAIDSLLHQVLGKGFEYDGLMSTDGCHDIT